MSNLVERSVQHIKNKLVEYGISLDETQFIVAVSGGADSVSMLLLLTQIVPKKNMICAHFNHMLRGEESDRDEKFVSDLCSKIGVSFIRSSGDVAKYACDRKIGLEEAARILRYDFLRSLKNGQNSLICVAHTQDDNAETILMHLGRSCGLDGATGLRFLSNDILRPVLNLTRIQTEKICNFYDVKYVIDSTNNQDICLRNNVRHNVLPVLNKYFDDFGGKLVSFANNISSDADYLNNIASNDFHDVVDIFINQSLVKIDFNLLKSKPIPISYRILKMIISSICDYQGNIIYPDGKDLPGTSLTRVLSYDNNSSSNRTKTIEIGRDISLFISTIGSFIGTKDAYFAYKEQINKKKINKDWIFVIDYYENNNNLNINYNEDFCQYFDKDILYSDYKINDESDIITRCVRDDDVFIPYGQQNPVILRKFLINSKVSASDRKQLKVVAIDNQIIWIPGVRRSSAAPITENTKNIIKVSFGG